MIQDDYTFEEEEEKEFIEECKTIVAVPDAVEHQLEVAGKIWQQLYCFGKIL